ncbi:MAG: tRNA dihydrouridine(20/20a) synthase DusA [Xanthomonadales bacterium]|nr:tRNA dihydrouridine(20/20a) synthase DusA [Xanthomonadales bacterium]
MTEGSQFPRSVLDRRLNVAPMMDWTDRHCRRFHRVLAPSALLYTEMVTTGAVLHGDRERLIGYSPEEHPLALQLGGSEPDELAASARIAEQWGYDEVNLNVGCPSDRVQRGRFGACLMLEADRVRDGVAAMRDAVDIPVTVKTRLGVDDHDSWGFFSDFIGTVAESGCTVFIVHARKAWLSGLSPKENREVPELRYEWVHRLKRERPGLTVVLNGGIRTVDEAEKHLGPLDGVMLGRAAYQTPWLLAELQARWFEQRGTATREEAVEHMTDYLREQVERGVPAARISRHMLGLFQGRPGARRWRQYISQHAHLDRANGALLLEALAHMQAVAPIADST